jgi:hypothetical protein
VLPRPENDCGWHVAGTVLPFWLDRGPAYGRGRGNRWASMVVVENAWFLEKTFEWLT